MKLIELVEKLGFKVDVFADMPVMVDGIQLISD
jgi:hypothetical protein